MADTLVLTKLQPPWGHRPSVTRTELVARVRVGLTGPITLVCAPAGSGKTSLVLQALDRHVEAVAWLSLEADDSDPTRFGHYLLAAMSTAVPGLSPALDPLQHSRPLDLLSTMATLVNVLSTRRTPLVFVLEDYHTLDAPLVDQALAWLLVHAPPALRLLVTSREDPQLPLGRLRARGQLTEVRGADLRFSAAEAAALLADLTGLTLSDRQVDDLVTRTEGWAVGLQLASLALRETADIDGLIASLRGTHRLVFDYLTEEVLLGQSGELQQFLLQTSILDRLCGELCDAVLASDDERRGARTLRLLEHANLFLVPLDPERRWYRYHSLFAEMLRARLTATASDSVALLHRRAAAWFATAIATHGTAMLDPAIQHALDGGDHELAADLIEHGMLTPANHATGGAAPHAAPGEVEHVNPHLIGRGDLALTAHWLSRLPPDLPARRPVLALMQAWMLTLTGQHRAAELSLRRAESAVAASSALGSPDDAGLISANISCIAAYLSFMRGRLSASMAQATQSLSQVPSKDTSVRSAAHLILGRGALESDQLALAERELRLATSCGLTGDNPYAALVAQGWLGEMLRRQGRLDEAEQLLTTALEGRRDPSGTPFPIAGELCVRLGLVHYEQDRLGSAALLLDQGRRCGEVMSNGWMVEPAGLMLAWLRQVDGDSEGAHRILDALEAQAPRMENMVDPRQISAQRARLRLASGDLPAVAAWLEEEQAAGSRADTPAEQALVLMRARALIALDRSAEAVALVTPLQAVAATAGRLGQLIQLQVLGAVALEILGDDERAMGLLCSALDEGAARGHVRSFVDEGLPVATLLQQVHPTDASTTSYVARLLAAFGPTDRTSAAQAVVPSFAPPRPVALRESLTARELELLHLVDAGLSNQAIADRLVLTVGTVKFYLSQLYRKLAARGRTEALARARHLGLLA